MLSFTNKCQLNFKSARPNWQGYNDVGFHGSEIKTPFLDSLNQEGVELRSYYGHMICTPSRSAVMSGRYAFHTGMQHSFWGTGQDGGLPLKFKTMADHLKAAGFATHMIGKVCTPA